MKAHIAGGSLCFPSLLGEKTTPKTKLGGPGLNNEET